MYFAPGKSDFTALETASLSVRQHERETQAGKIFYNACEFLQSRHKSETEFTSIENARYRASLLLGYLEHGKVEDVTAYAENYTSQAFFSRGCGTLAPLKPTIFYQEILPSLELLCKISVEKQPENTEIVRSAQEVKKSLEQLVQFGGDLENLFPNQIERGSREVQPGVYLMEMSLPQITETRGDVTKSVSWSDRAKELSSKCKEDLRAFIEEADRSIALADKWVGV